VTLSELQGTFVECVWGRRTPAELFPLLRARGGATAAERVAFYEGALGRRAIHRLERAFPVTARLLGRRRLSAAASEHFRRIGDAARPRPDLIRAWPAFLATVPDIVGRPDVADLAALELARADVTIADDSPTAALEGLRHFRSDEVDRLRLQFAAAVALVPASFEVSRLWPAVQRGSRPRPRRAAADVIVWRRGRRVLHGTVGTAEAVALRSAIAGAPLAIVCEAFAGERSPGRAAHTAIAGWFTDGLVASIIAPAA
jgi:hypothetical protein